MPDKPPYEPVYEEDEDAPPPKIQFGSSESALSGSDVEVVGIEDDAPMELNADDFETL
jgi:hypothetical protein